MHRTACPASDIQESAHINGWKTRKSWVWRELKRAVLEKRTDDFLIEIATQPKSNDVNKMSLGLPRKAITVTHGQKIAYEPVLPIRPRTALSLLRLPSTPTCFLSKRPSRKQMHSLPRSLRISRRMLPDAWHAAGMRRVESFHFSPRYSGQEARLINEVMAAFVGKSS